MLGLVALTVAVAGLALLPTPSPAQVKKTRPKLASPPNFIYQVDFGRDYTIKPTPLGFTSGISAWTTVSTSWQSDGRGHVTVTLAVDRSRSWALDWVFNPQSIGATPASVAALRAHEQVHLDLTALAVREFWNQVQGLPDNQVKTRWDNFMKRLNSLDALYEASTQQGLNGDNQDLWVQQINLLKSRPDGTFTALERWAQRFRN
jgi:hypothetical protein